MKTKDKSGNTMLFKDINNVNIKVKVYLRDFL